MLRHSAHEMWQRAQEKVNYVQKVYYAHYVVLIIDDTGQVKGETCMYSAIKMYSLSAL